MRTQGGEPVYEAISDRFFIASRCSVMKAIVLSCTLAHRSLKGVWDSLGVQGIFRVLLLFVQYLCSVQWSENVLQILCFQLVMDSCSCVICQLIHSNLLSSVPGLLGGL